MESRDMTTEDVLDQWPAYYCEEHDAVSTIWNCYCGKQTTEVVVKVVRKEVKKRDA